MAFVEVTRSVYNLYNYVNHACSVYNCSELLLPSPYSFYYLSVIVNCLADTSLVINSRKCADRVMAMGYETFKVRGFGGIIIIALHMGIQELPVKPDSMC